MADRFMKYHEALTEIYARYKSKAFSKDLIDCTIEEIIENNL